MDLHPYHLYLCQSYDLTQMNNRIQMKMEMGVELKLDIQLHPLDLSACHIVNSDIILYIVCVPVVTILTFQLKDYAQMQSYLDVL